MSPTKASLARFNPSLLPPLKPAESQRPSSRGPDIQNRGTRDGLNGGAVRQSGQEAVTHERTPKPSLGANGTGLRATPRRRSRTPGEHDTSLRNARSAVPQSPRASPPDEGREEGNGVQVIQVEGDTRAAGGHNSIFQEASAPLVPATGPGSRQPITPRFPGLPRLSSGMGQSDDGEPSLPSTPVHLGIEKPPERAKGLLFSSPSRRPRRHGTSSVKSSPLKPQAPVPDLSVARPPHVYTFLGPQTYIPNTPRPLFTAEEVEQRNMRETLARLEKQLQEIEGQLTRHVLVSKWQEGDRRGVKELSKRTKEVLQKSAKIIRSREELGKRQIQEGTGSVDQEMVDASA